MVILTIFQGWKEKVNVAYLLLIDKVVLGLWQNVATNLYWL